MKHFLYGLFFAVLPAFGAVTFKEEVRVTLIRGASTVVSTTLPSVTACVEEAKRLSALSGRTTGQQTYSCEDEKHRLIATFSAGPATCAPPQPENISRAGACPAGTTGIWTQTQTFSCPASNPVWTASEFLPTSPPPGICKTIPPPPIDTDGDGLLDNVDQCPTLKGLPPTGCPVITPPPPTSGFLPIDPLDPADAPLVKFGETALRNWNFEGHVVDAQFNEDYGKWDPNGPLFEPHLFDRVSVAYIMWKRTGDPRWRTEFDLLFAIYRTHIDARGIFTIKGQSDTKYSYVRPFYYYEQETGDTQYRAIAKRIYDAWVQELPNAYSPNIGLWTEREVGLALDAAIFYYKLTGEPTALMRAKAMVAHFGSVAEATGAPLHPLSQHGEEFDNAYAPMMMTSSWMAALYFQALKTYYDTTQDQEALRQISRYVDFIDANGLVDGSSFHQEFTGVTVPYYLYGVGTFYDRETPSEGDMAHCLDVAGLFKFGIKAKIILGQNTLRADTRYFELRQCAVREFTNWTRSTQYLPKYRLTPPRKFNWWVRAEMLR